MEFIAWLRICAFSAHGVSARPPGFGLSKSLVSDASSYLVLASSAQKNVAGVSKESGCT